MDLKRRLESRLQVSLLVRQFSPIFLCLVWSPTKCGVNRNRWFLNFGVPFSSSRFQRGCVVCFGSLGFGWREGERLPEEVVGYVTPSSECNAATLICVWKLSNLQPTNHPLHLDLYKEYWNPGKGIPNNTESSIEPRSLYLYTITLTEMYKSFLTNPLP